MSDFLLPLRRVCGDEAPPGPPPSPGDAGYVEHALLSQTWEALASLPRHTPSEATLAAVLAEARLAPVVATAATPAEAALVRQAASALAALPAAAPAADAREAVLRRAAEAARAVALVPVRHVYAEPDAPAPAPGSPAAREADLLRGSVAALGSLPPYRPSAEAVAAVLEEARRRAGRSAAAAGGASRTMAADRAPARAARRRRPVAALWAGGALFAALLVVAVGVLLTPADAPVQVASGGPPAVETITAETATAGLAPVEAAVAEASVAEASVA
ncbi:MAG: hypothetical protein ACK41D_12535, partial [Rubricoccaceae bacterium]